FIERLRAPAILASMKHDLGAKSARAILKHSGHSGLHVFSRKQWRRDLINRPVRRADATVQIRSDYSFAGIQSQRGAAGKALSKGPRLCFEPFIWKDLVHDIP